MVPERFLDELKQRVSLPDLIGRRVRLLKRAGTLTGLCPFHHERSPSFRVYDDHYHCYGCGASGDAIEWLKRIEARDFMEAVRELAGQAGLDVPAEPGGFAARNSLSRQKGEGANASAEFRAEAALTAAAAYYAARLRDKSDTASWAREYLTARGITEEAIARFELGFAPGGDNGRQALRQALLAQGHAMPALKDAGLIALDEDGRDLGRDRFQMRIMIPIRDHAGQVVGFGGRALEAKAAAKYLNSPSGPLFDKSRLLFNLDRARAKAQEAGRRLVIVEGYMDVIALDAAGFGHAVAPMGTALTEAQLRRAWRLAPWPVLCLDGDEAGWKAALRAMELALPLIEPMRGLAFARLPDGLDPDDMLRSPKHGPKAFQAMLDSPLDIADLIWAKAWTVTDTSGPSERAAAEAELHRLWALIQHPMMARHIGDDLMARLDAERMARRKEMGRKSARTPLSQPEAAAKAAETLATASRGEGAFTQFADWLEGRSGIVFPSQAAAAEGATLLWNRWKGSCALGHIEIAKDLLWRPTEAGLGRPALYLPVENARDEICDVLAIPIDGGEPDWWRLTGCAEALGVNAVLAAKVKGAALKVFFQPMDLIEAWLQGGGEGLLEEFGYCPLEALIDLEAAFAGVPALIARNQDEGEAWAARLDRARKRRRELEWKLPDIWLPQTADGAGEEEADDESEAAA